MFVVFFCFVFLGFFGGFFVVVFFEGGGWGGSVSLIHTDKLRSKLFNIFSVTICTTVIVKKN